VKNNRNGFDLLKERARIYDGRTKKEIKGGNKNEAIIPYLN